MKTPDTVKWLYWVLLVVAGGWFNVWRLYSRPADYPTTVDLAAFGAWILLLLVPLFDEIKVGELTVKRAVQEAKAELKDQILSVRAELQTIRTQATSQVFIGGPLPSEQALSSVRRDIEAAVPEVKQRAEAPPGVPDYVSRFAQLRFALEREVRRLAGTWLFYFERQGQRPVPFWETLRDLEAEGAISTPLKQGARDVYNICSAALHGTDLTAEQVSFADAVGPGIVAAFEKIRPYAR